MKYAFMTFSCPKLPWGEVLALARRCGYDGVEPRIGSGHAHGLELSTPAAARKQAAVAAAGAGVAICCVATSCRFADPQLNEAMLAEARGAIDLAGDLGCPRLRVFGGKLGEGLSREQATGLVAKCLAGLADQAAARGVTLCMETHDLWCNPEHVAEVMRRVNHPAVGVNWDIMHPVRFEGWDMAAAFEVLRPWIRHVHFHDGGPEGDNYVLKPVGTGQIDHRTAVRLLRQAGLDVFLSGEWIAWSDGYEVHLPRELAAMKGYE